MSYIELDEGKIFYKVIGDGTPLMFIHGGPGMNHEYFLPFATQMVDVGYQVILFDQRGNGNSKEIEVDEVSVSEIVNDVERIRKELGLDRFSIFAHSYGNLIALRYCNEYPEYTDKLVMCSPGPSNKKELQEMKNRLYARLMEDGIMVWDLLSRVHAGDRVASEEFLGYSIVYQFYNFDMGSQFLVESKSRNMDKERFGLINQKLNQTMFEDLVPLRYCSKATVLRGRFDLIPESVSRGFGLEGIRQVILEKSGHYPFIEEPDKVMELIQALF